MKKLLLLGLIPVFIAGCQGKSWQDSDRAEVLLGNQKIILEVATSPTKREAGLSGRKELSEIEGMLFVFETKDYHSFWMKETFFPLDIVWLDGETIVDLKTMEVEKDPSNPQNIYRPGTKADKAIEFKKGIIEKFNLKKGEKLKITRLP